MADFSGLPFMPADILLPSAGFEHWSVIACDQFTSEPEYWQETAEIVGGSPSSLHLILPEASLGKPDTEEHIDKINATMREYLAQGIFTEYKNSLIYVERTQTDGRIRRGIVGQIDLAEYDFTPGSAAQIRATEGTVIERIPPRAAVRRGAALELPHVMLLIDDAERSVIEPLFADLITCAPAYDFDLMQGGGHIRGIVLPEDITEKVAEALQKLHKKSPDMLFAVGDGNHSLASAKRCYEEEAELLGTCDIPGRYALVEIVNIYDEALQFEPIHRVISGVEPEAVLEALLAENPGSYLGDGIGQQVGFICDGNGGMITIPDPPATLAVDTLQRFLDKYLPAAGGSIDYIHDDETAIRLGTAPGSMAFLLPAMGKDELFPSIKKDGVLPRKTFSMGHARDKRYYLEARRIK
ncbi:MAG: DUF1015 domain-containing protein [Lachnospiraceae bacterium]|nr:DUF1015 domain-containing protein [Candidatus Minthocola equi]